MSSPRKSRSDRSAKTSGRILRAAQKLFAFRGFDGTTMRAIAAEADVNLASIVYYFNNKEGLYLAVFRQYEETLMKERTKMLEEAELHPSLRAYARAFIEPAFYLLLDKSRGGPEHARLLWRLPQEPDFLGRKIHDEFYDPVIQEMSQKIRSICPCANELSISWHVHVMISIFHATLGEYVSRLEWWKDKAPWMEDPERVLQMIVNTAVLLISHPILPPEEVEGMK